MEKGMKGLIGCGLKMGRAAGPARTMARAISRAVLAMTLSWGLSGAKADAESRPEPAPGNETLHCQEINGGVLLEWNIAFFAPIHGFVISRDGQGLAKLPPEATSYFDAEVSAGTHDYSLEAVNFDGSILELGKCTVSVGDSGLRCASDGNAVKLEWGPILIDVSILKFRISRNGETIATVPPDQLSYVDRVFDVGSYRYQVHAVTGPESEFLVGSCSVDVSCFGIKHEVSGLQVRLAWGTTSIILPQPTFILTRDGGLVVKTPATEYTDTVPGAGEYLYRVYEDFGTAGAPIQQIGACKILVPGDVLPPPQDLVCVVADISPVPVPLPSPLDPSRADPTAVDSDGDGVVDSFLPQGSVLLKWTNPILYDKVVITRNQVIIASIPGTETSYVDHVRGGGAFFYGVFGVVADRKSRPAECMVEVPPGFIPPPQSFTCKRLDLILDPNDPDLPAKPAPGTDFRNAPFDVVILQWSNPILYAELVISRDGETIAKLDGSAMAYRDIAPPPGPHVYGIFGIVDDGRQSPAVECILGDGVPPVFDLQCLVTQISSDIPTGSVILAWQNAARYDAILILRNGELIFEDSGEGQKYHDVGLKPGIYVYDVIGVLGGEKGPPTSCQAVILGPPEKNLLFFSPGLLPGPLADGVDPTLPRPIPAPGNRITCLASNMEPLEGWSFGVQSDPKFIVPRSTDLKGTETEKFNGGVGPAFLHVQITPDGSGVVMAAVIGESEPFETLPSGMGHSLLNIEYGPGPAGSPGQTYEVRYSDSLGSPPVEIVFVVKGFEVTPSTLPGLVSLRGPAYRRGDSNGDGEVDMSDAVTILAWLFLGGKEPGCLEAANANGSTAANIADPIYLLQFLFNGGPSPPFPFPSCSVAPAPLGCNDPGSCEPNTAG